MGRTVPLEVALLGNVKDLEASLIRAGIVAEDSSKKIAGSAAMAGRAAAEQARAMGASADVQEHAAARAAVAFTEAASKMTTAQKVAGEAASNAARMVGASLDEQRAAYARAIASTAEYEAATKRAAEESAAAAKASASAVEAATAREAKARKVAAAEAKSHAASFAALGGKVLKVGALGGTLGVVAAVKSAMTYQTALASVAANSDISAAAANRLGMAFLDTAGRTIFSAGQIASAYASVAGQLKITEGRALSEADALRVMDAAGNLAEATQTSLATSTSALSVVMQAYHMSVGQAAGASDMLFNVSRAMNVPIEAVASGVDKLHGRLGVLAPTLADTSALMIELGQHGITGTRGVTVVNTALQTLVGGSTKVQKTLGDLHVHIFDTQGRFIGLSGVIQQLQPKLAGLTEQSQLLAVKTLFGSGAAQVMNQIVAGGVPKFQQAADAARKMGTAHAAAAAQAKTFQHELETAKATVTDLATRFGMFLIPRLEAVARAVQSVIGWFDKHKAAAEILAATITTVLGAAISVFVYTKAVAFVGAVGGMAKGMTQAAVTIAAKMGLVDASATTMAATVTTAGDEIVASADTTAAGVDLAIGSTGVGLIVIGLGVAIVELATHWKQAMHDIESVTQAALNNVVIPAINAVIDIINKASSLVHTLTFGLAGGGQIGKLHNVQLTAPTSYNGRTIGSTAPGGMDSTLGRGVSPTIPIPQSGSNWQKIAQTLAWQGFSRNAIAGILGNFAQETGGGSLSAINTRDSGTGASGMGGMGIAQWTAQRRLAEMHYAAQHHEAPTSLVAQIGYLIQELRTNYHNAFKAIQNAPSAAAAAAVFNKLFEGGTDPGGVRERSAQQAYALLASLFAKGQPKGPGGSRYGRGTLPGSLSATTRSLLYADPLHGDTYAVERTDQGKDYGNIKGNIGAIGDGIITLAQNLQGFGQTIVERLTKGPNKGQYVYYGYETGATGVGIRQGQTVRAGQTIGRGLGTGGVEFGFWNPKTGRAEGAPYFSGANATPPGEAFAKWMAQLSHGGTFTTTKGGVTSGGGTNYGYSVAQLEQAFTKALVSAGNSLISKFTNAIQSGTVKTLSAALGATTGGKTALGLSRIVSRLGDSATLSQVASTGKGSITAALTKGVAGSAQGKSYQREVVSLIAAGQIREAAALVAAHKAAMAALAQELYAAQLTKDAESLKLQATQLTDMTRLNSEVSAATITTLKAEQQTINDANASMVQSMRDAQKTIDDQMAGIAQAIKDAATINTDQSNLIVTGINDSTQTAVDRLGERGLYGLNLVAQKLQVQLDETKAYWDKQLATDQLQLDQLQAQANAAENAALINLDQVTASENLLVAAALANQDQVTAVQDARIAAATAHADAVQLQVDTKIIGPAQTAVDLNATAPKAVQDLYGAQLAKATARGDSLTSAANAALGSTTNSANAAIQAATGAYNNANNAAQYAIQGATNSLQSIIDYFNIALAKAGAKLSGDQAGAALAEAPLQAGVSVTSAQAQTQYAGSGLTVIQYMMPPGDASANAEALGWALRTLMPA